jgi:hypothetical protein
MKEGALLVKREWLDSSAQRRIQLPLKDFIICKKQVRARSASVLSSIAITNVYNLLQIVTLTDPNMSVHRWAALDTRQTTVRSL